MSEFTRKASLFGGPKVVLGTESTDLVLETLGKIYIKTGKKARLLNDVFKLLDNLNDPKEDVGGKTFIVETLSDLLNTFKYPGDGYLIFVSQEQSLYISYDDRYLLLIEEVVDPTNNTTTEENAPGFVRRRGDRMTGQLEIAVGDEKAPLIIASSKLVENLNAQFLNGYASHELAIKKLNEYILGNWTFEKDTQFNANVNVASDITVGNNSYVHGNQEVGYDLLVKNKATVKLNIHAEKDIVLTGSIGSPEFMSGYNGYGWRFDADTNMLTVDYLVVRKAMQVFELIVNRIQATNGSLWVTDSCEVKEITEITYQAVETTTLNKTNFLEVASIQNEVNLKKDYLNIAKNTFTYSGNLLANTNYATDALYFIENEYFNLLDQHKDKFPILEVQHLCTTYNNLYSNYTDNVYEVPSVTQIRLPLGGASIKIMSSNVSSLKINGLNVDDLTELIFINNSSNNYNDVATVTVEAELEEGTTEWMYSIGYHYSEILQQILDCQVTNYFYQLFLTPDVIDNPIGIDDLKDRSTFESKIQTLESNIETLEAEIAAYNIESTIDLPRGVWVALNRLEQSIHGKYLKSVNGVFEDENVIFYTYSHIMRINDYNKVSTMINNRLSNLNIDDVLTPTSFLQLLLCNPSTDDVEFRLQLLETKNADNNPIIQCVETIDPEFYNAVMFSTDNKLEIDTLDEITVLKTYYKYFGLTKERQDLLESNILANTYIVKMKDDSYATFDTGDIIRCQKFEDHSIKYYDALVGSRIDAYTYVIIKSPSVFDTQITVSTDGDGNLNISTELNLNQYNKTFSGYYRESNVTYYKLNGIDINYTPIIFSYMYNVRQLDRSEKPLFIDDKYIEDINDIKFSLFTKIAVDNIDDYSTVFKDLSGNLFTLSTEDFTIVPAFTGTYIKLRYVNVNGTFYIVEENDKITYFGNEYEVIDGKVTIGENIFNVLEDTYEINPLIEGVDSRIVTLIKYNNEFLSNEDFICYILSDVRVSLAADGLVAEYYQAPTTDGLESERVQTSRVIAEIAPKDGLVRVGNLMNSQRQNSVFITSSEWDSPYVQTMSGVCRPDYTVAYKQPKFSKWKARTAVNSIRFKFIQKSEEAIADKIYLLPTDEEFIQSVLDKATYTTFTEILKCVVKLYFDGFKFNDLYYTFVDSIPNNDETAYLKFEIETTQITDKLTGEVSTKYLATYCDHIKARFGKLDGIEHENFSRNNLTQPHGYGLYGENVYLTGEFVLSNGKSIATIGDDILFKVAESGLHITEDGIVLDADKIQINNGEKTAALFKDGKILADYIDVKDISTDRLIAKKYGYETYTGSLNFTYPNAVTSLTEKYTFAYTTTYLFDFEHVTYKVCGFSGNYIELWPKENLVPYSNTNLTYKYTDVHNLYFTQIIYVTDGTDIYKFKYYYNTSNKQLQFSEVKLKITDINEILAIIPILETDSIKILGSEKSLSVDCTLPYKKRVQVSTSDVLTINKNDLGEIILYWPNGSIKYVRLENSDDENISQYVEYWYAKDKCTLEDIKLGIDYLDRKGNYQKRLDALENPFVIDQYVNYFTTAPLSESASAEKNALLEWLLFWLNIFSDRNLNWYYEVATNPLKVLYDQKNYEKLKLDKTYGFNTTPLQPIHYDGLLEKILYIEDVNKNEVKALEYGLRIYVPRYTYSFSSYEIYKAKDGSDRLYVLSDSFVTWRDSLEMQSFEVEEFEGNYWAKLSQNSDPIKLHTTSSGLLYAKFTLTIPVSTKELIDGYNNAFLLEDVDFIACVYDSVKVRNMWYPIFTVFLYGTQHCCIGYSIQADNGLPKLVLGKYSKRGEVLDFEDPFVLKENTVLFRDAEYECYKGIFLDFDKNDYGIFSTVLTLKSPLLLSSEFKNRKDTCLTYLRSLNEAALARLINFILDKITVLTNYLPEAILFLETVLLKFNTLRNYNRSMYQKFIDSIVIPEHLKMWFFADPTLFAKVDDIYVLNNNLLIPQFDLHVRAKLEKTSYNLHPKYLPYITNATEVSTTTIDIPYVHEGYGFVQGNEILNRAPLLLQDMLRLDDFDAAPMLLTEADNYIDIFTVQNPGNYVSTNNLYYTVDDGYYEDEPKIYYTTCFGRAQRVFKNTVTDYAICTAHVEFYANLTTRDFNYCAIGDTFIIDGREIYVNDVEEYLRFKYFGLGKITTSVQKYKEKTQLVYIIQDNSYVLFTRGETWIEYELIEIASTYTYYRDGNTDYLPVIGYEKDDYGTILDGDYSMYNTYNNRAELSGYFDVKFLKFITFIQYDGSILPEFASGKYDSGYLSNAIFYSFNEDISEYANQSDRSNLRLKLSIFVDCFESNIGYVDYWYYNTDLNLYDKISCATLTNTSPDIITSTARTFDILIPKGAYASLEHKSYIVISFNKNTTSKFMLNTGSALKLQVEYVKREASEKLITINKNSYRGLQCALAANSITGKFQLGIKLLNTYFLTLLHKTIAQYLTTSKSAYKLQKFGNVNPLVFTLNTDYKGIDLTKLYFKEQWAHIANLIAGKNKIASYNTDVVKKYTLDYPTIIVEKEPEPKLTYYSDEDLYNVFIPNEVEVQYTSNANAKVPHRRWLTWDGSSYESVCFTTDTKTANSDFCFIKTDFTTYEETNKLFNYDADTGIPLDNILAFEALNTSLSNQNLHVSEIVCNELLKNDFMHTFDISYIGSSATFSNPEYVFYKDYLDIFVPKYLYITDIYAMLFERSIAEKTEAYVKVISSAYLNYDGSYFTADYYNASGHYDNPSSGKFEQNIGLLCVPVIDVLGNGGLLLYLIYDGTDVDLLSIHENSNAYEYGVTYTSSYPTRLGPKYHTNELRIINSENSLEKTYSKNYLYIAYPSQVSPHPLGYGAFTILQNALKEFYSKRSYVYYLYSPFTSHYYSGGVDSTLPYIYRNDAQSDTTQEINILSVLSSQLGGNYYRVYCGLITHLKNLYTDEFYWKVGHTASGYYRNLEYGTTGDSGYSVWRPIDLSKASESGYILNPNDIQIQSDALDTIGSYIILPKTLVDGLELNGYKYNIVIQTREATEITFKSIGNKFGKTAFVYPTIVDQYYSFRGKTLSSSDILVILYKTKVE